MYIYIQLEHNEIISELMVFVCLNAFYMKCLNRTHSRRTRIQIEQILNYIIDEVLLMIRSPGKFSSKKPRGVRR